MANSYLDDISVVKSMAETPILVVGDVMLDRYVYGHVERISPESPVPILSVDRENMMLGGAGNTLSNLIHLKCNGKLLSVVGEDESGQQIRKLAHTLNIDTSGLLTCDDRPTVVKTRFLAGHQQLLRTDFERIVALPQETLHQLCKKAEELIRSVRAVVISDYGKGLLTPQLVSTVIELAHKRRIPVLVDPKGKDYSKYAGADVVTPNKKELSEATEGQSVTTDDEITNAARLLIQKSGIKAVIATRSKDGMSVIEKDNEPVHIRSATDIEVFDVSGAGDTVIATLAGALAVGADLIQAAALANVAGSIVVSKVGTAPIRAEELITVLGHNDPATDILARGASRQSFSERSRQAPVLTWAEAKEDVERWKARGLSVGFTNGCFDVLHYGHVSYLNAARRRCDRLIVGLNTDESVRILKGADRPVHDQNARSGVIAALGAVDLVVLFGAKNEGEDNTACALIEMLHPDVYFKGGDYKIEQIPEAPSVHSYGGRVEVMDVFNGHSTTGSIERIRKDRVA